MIEYASMPVTSYHLVATHLIFSPEDAVQASGVKLAKMGSVVYNSVTGAMAAGVASSPTAAVMNLGSRKSAGQTQYGAKVLLASAHCFSKMLAKLR